MTKRDKYEQYSEWIKQNVTNPTGKCSSTTQEMVKQFPELTRVRGHYYCPVWGEREHWWLKDPAGKIIDPTAEQFPSKGKGHYEEWDENEEEPTGKCMNCGGYCYSGKQFCSCRCESECMADFL